MSDMKIIATKPLKLEDGSGTENLYSTHLICHPDYEEPFALIADYTQDPIAVYVAQYNQETNTMESTAEEVGFAIAKFLTANPLELPTLEQIQEALES